jgi:Protein of unknown function (DUF3618)
MAETTADVRRDIELTRERMSDTLAQLEHKLNVVQVVRENPWPALALAVGAGVLLASSRTDVKTAAAAVKATGGASSKLGSLLDEAASRLITGVSAALAERVDGWVDELKSAIGDRRSTGVPQLTDRPVAGTYPGAPQPGTIGPRAD